MLLANVQLLSNTNSRKTSSPPCKGQAREGAKRAPELTVPALSIASEISYRLKGYIASIPVQFVVDTGASVSLLSTDVWHRVSANKHMELKEWQ